MPTFKVYLWEWDTENGEYVYRDYEGETVEAANEEDLWRTLESWLRDIAKEAAGEGWDCEFTPNAELLCTRCEEGYCESRQIGYDVEKVSP
ncbi:hypothetical protein [Alphaspiravirus yamagawaense]|uniref:Uncharacterized protein n=1 Tax=Alphaspiravirus yamagawaense TaxID=1157339 RepID=J7Q330_9VIRU|nr:hypothetical protein [Aeropyrum coil-shaped virus]CCG27858.1 hypothetical protein [Aeropyrum coil-shaped virus]